MKIQMKNLVLATIAGLFGTEHVTKHTGLRIGRKDGGMDPEAVKTAISTALTQRDADINKLIAKGNEEIANQGKMTEQTKLELKAAVDAGKALGDRLTAMEQEFVALKEAGKRGPEHAKSIGERFTDDGSFTELASKGRGTAMLRLKTINSITTAGGAGGTGAVGSAVAPDRLPGILTPALRQFTIRDLLLPGRTSSNAIQYVQETGFQNMAAPVAEGAQKPQSDLTSALLTTTVKTIAHWVKASTQILADVPQLQSYIDTRLTYGLKYVEEAELLSGDGTGQHLLGLIPQATPFDATKSKAGDRKIDTLRRAILQVRIAEWRASGIVLNPSDWADIELEKDTVGRYLWVNVQTGGEPQMWRLPVVDSSAMPIGHFMVGAFNLAAQVLDREDSNIQVSTEDGDNFIKNMVTIRCEERLALIVWRPEALIYGPFPEGGLDPVT